MTLKATCMILFAVGSGTIPHVVATQRPAPSPVAIAFELVSSYIVLKVSVNKSRPLSFLLDTGATKAIIRMDTAKELSLALHGSLNAAGAGGGTQAGRFVKDAKWSLIGLDGFAQPVTLALPLPQLPFALGRDVHGIIGGDFIKQFVVELDYQARIMTLHGRDTFVYSGPGETLPLEFNSDEHPVLKATVTPSAGKPVAGKFLLDIGSGLALTLHSPFVAEHNLLGPESKTVPSLGGAGAGGRTTGRTGRVAALQVGSFVLENPITMFSQDKAGAFANPSLAGNIGARIATRFRTFLDYGRKRIILERSATFADPFDRAFSGLGLRAEGPGYRTFVVREVLEGSAANDAGIQAGDIIESIDQAGAASLTLSLINEMFEQPVARQLTIRRAEQTIRVTLTPRRLD